ncbi:ABC transporter substrate-binding protein [Methanoculleus sp. Afa-1]|uniref:ABC transporter substrate-binding protein n=1 Tax=Methanoculleus formosensis TaxID=2590886 RepID=A0A9E5DF39_9EURY|nr:ABC transporter substrate-binding protein [Methanoculleus sp. Afa-1]MCT8336791.1 ABC transporter substrate-binding protein [Methanoculleus sp. Afa-1]
MTIYLGIDDTDTLESRGTGRLARAIAAELARSYTVTGVTRHQLFVHPAVPYTSHNSSAVIHIRDTENVIAGDVFATAKEMMLADFIEGSDPGICVAAGPEINGDLSRFGFAAKTSIVTQKEARTLARDAGILLEGLGGTEDGVIGALAGVGLAASGNDGRFVQKGTTRDLRGSQTIAAILASGVDRVETREGAAVGEGTINLRKFPKPAFIGGKAILYVEADGDGYRDIVMG